MRYTKIATAKPFEGKPLINTPSVYGGSPKKPILFRIPVAGQRPITYGAIHLPEGLTLNENIISGSVETEGLYEITLTAENALGKAEKNITFEIKRDQVLLTPLIGYTSWNDAGYEVSQEHMEKTAEKMMELGLPEFGFRYINTDSGWQGTYGGKYDSVQPNEKFPDIKGMCDKLHSMGYLCGIYSTPMLNAFGCSIKRVPLPPGCTQGDPDDRFADERGGIGVIRKEKNHALQWAEWGFDYLKYDWRPSDPINAELMRQELVQTDRDFGFCVTVRARPEYHKYWEKYCCSYRNNPDCIKIWDRTMEIYHSYFDFIPYVNRGHYFDLDMLDVGYCDLFRKLIYTENPDYGYTEDEEILIYTLRAFFASPIQISCDVNQIDEFLLSVLCNEEMIAINQDALFDGAKPYLLSEDDMKMIHIWKRKLENGDCAYAIFNLGKTEETSTIYFEGCCNVRDVWAKEDLGTFTHYTCTTKPHTVQVIRVTP